MYHNENIVEKSKTELIIHSFMPESTNNRDIFKCVVESQMLDEPLKKIFFLDIEYPALVRFVRNEQNLTVNEGTDFSLTCFAESNPITTEIFWETNGQWIKQEIENKKNVHLNIVNIKQHYEGKYTCVARNEVGSDKKSVYISVLCCQVQTEMTDTSVMVSISVVAAVIILLGIIILHTKDKLKRGNKIQDDMAVENQLFQSRDDIADDRAYPQSNLAVGEQDNRMESSDGSVRQGPVNSQTNNGLNYAEISFTPGSSGSRFLVHGKENMTIYSNVVLPLSTVAEHLDQ